MLDLQASDQVLEVGFGHGRALAAAADIVTDGFLAGVDHSDVMLRIARSRNAGLLRSGHMELTLGDSAHIPYPNGRFNKLFTVHTIYFWPDPERQIEKVNRVMSDDARLVIGYRPSDDGGLVDEFPASVYTIRSIKEVENLVAGAGLQNVKSMTQRLSSNLLAWTVAAKVLAEGDGAQGDR